MSCVCVWTSLKVPAKSDLRRWEDVWNLSWSWKRFCRVNKRFLPLERRLHFCSWITAARLPVARSTTSCHQHWSQPRVGFLLVHIVTSSSENHSACLTWRKRKTDYFFSLSKLIWKLDRRKLSGLLNVFFYYRLFSINRKIFTDFWKLTKTNFLKRTSVVIIHPWYKKLFWI